MPNLLVEMLSQPQWQRIALTLVHFLWQGLAIAVGLAAILRLFRVRESRSRYGLSLAALALMTVCPVVTFVVVQPASESFVANSSEALLAIESDRERLMADPAAIVTSTASESDSLRVLPSVQPYLLAGWLAGILMLSARLSLGFAGVWRLRRSTLSIQDDVQERVTALGRRLGVSTVGRVFASQRVKDAIAVGFWRQIVLLPASWLAEMTPQMLDAIIAHELAHIRRHDLWANLFQRVMETIFFYHPAVWWLSRRIRDERELCCDELAVTATGKRMEYANALQVVARKRKVRVRPSLAAAIRGEKKMNLLRRVRNVLGVRPDEDRGNWWPTALLLLALPVGILAVSTGFFTGGQQAVFADDDDRNGERRRERDSGDRARRERESDRERDRDGFYRDRPRREEGGRDRDERRDDVGHRKIERRVIAFAIDGDGNKGEVDVEIDKEKNQIIIRLRVEGKVREHRIDLPKLVLERLGDHNELTLERLGDHNVKFRHEGGRIVIEHIRIHREGDDREGERRERDRQGDRERRDGDRRDGERRDSDRERGERERGDRERRDRPRHDGENHEHAHGEHDHGHAHGDELIRLLHELRREVMQLRRDVQELKLQHGHDAHRREAEEQRHRAEDERERALKLNDQIRGIFELRQRRAEENERDKRGRDDDDAESGQARESLRRADDQRRIIKERIVREIPVVEGAEVERKERRPDREREGAPDETRKRDSDKRERRDEDPDQKKDDGEG
ncbi:MAG: M48 family metalloprotease [Planctomycetes bacterium]|nr:M48 family metalloprotease [Planctomycetota bacterium]